MGFSDYTRSILETNRQLRTSVKRTYLNRAPASYISTNSKPILSSERADYQSILRSKRRKITRMVLILALLTSAISIAVYRYMDAKVPQMIEARNQKMAILVQERKDEMARRNYGYWIEMGDRNLAAHDYEEARKNYQMALKSKKSGKLANYGLTICLLVDCKQNGHNCELSEEYYQTLVKSNTFDGDEIDVLDGYR